MTIKKSTLETIVSFTVESFDKAVQEHYFDNHNISPLFFIGETVEEWLDENINYSMFQIFKFFERYKESDIESASKDVEDHGSATKYLNQVYKNLLYYNTVPLCIKKIESKYPNLNYN